MLVRATLSCRLLSQAPSGALALAVVAALLSPGCRPSMFTPSCADSAACPSTHYCRFAADACGHARSRGECTPRPASCAPDVAAVCGCDERTYDNACLAQAAGTDVARAGACDAACAPDDAQASGTCELALGWYWDGFECHGLSGCVCEGVDCGEGTATMPECDALHEICSRGGGDAGLPTDAGGGIDAGAALDGGSALDAGGGIDAGAALDAGP